MLLVLCATTYSHAAEDIEDDDDIMVDDDEEFEKLMPEDEAGDAPQEELKLPEERVWHVVRKNIVNWLQRSYI